MPTPRAGWVPFDLSAKMDDADIADADAVPVVVPMPVSGYIKEAWMAAGVSPTAGNLQLWKFVSSAASINLLPTVNVAIDASAISNYTASQITLTTNPANLRVAAGQTLLATWTFTTKGSGTAPSLVVWVEPDTW